MTHGRRTVLFSERCSIAIGCVVGDVGKRSSALVMLLAGTLASTASAQQFVINYIVDQPEAQAALGPMRLAKMNSAINECKRFFEAALAGSNVTLNVPVRWQALIGANAVAETSTTYAFSTLAVVKNRLNAVAAAAPDNSEPASETAVYDLLPNTQVSFVWAANDNPAQPRTTSQILLTYAQALQLGLNPKPPNADQFKLAFKPPSSISGLQWQFWDGPVKGLNRKFTAALAHETMHALGYQSACDNEIAPTYITLLDLYRFSDVLFPAGATLFSSGVRELRPTTEASVATRLQATLGNGGYQMSRGTPPGGDTYQGAHFRLAALLQPQVPIGLMDPVIDSQTPILVASRFAEASRADLQVLDMLGWVIDPPNARLQIAGVLPTQLTPLADARIRNTCPLFTWSDTETDSETYTINVFNYNPTSGAYVENPDPIFSFEQLPGFSFCPDASSQLPPGTYWWNLVGKSDTMLGGYYTDYRSFTILCTADLVGVGGQEPGDGSITADDLIYFLAGFFAGNLTVADIAGVGGTAGPDQQLTVDDLVFYLSHFFAGC